MDGGGNFWNNFWQFFETKSWQGYNMCQCAQLGDLCINQFNKIINQFYFLKLFEQQKNWKLNQKISKTEFDPPPTIKRRRVIIWRRWVVVRGTLRRIKCRYAKAFCASTRKFFQYLSPFHVKQIFYWGIDTRKFQKIVQKIGTFGGKYFRRKTGL